MLVIASMRNLERLPESKMQNWKDGYMQGYWCGGDRKRGREEDAYLVSTSFVRDVFGVAVDIIHRVGLGGDILFGGLGDGVVLGYVCHFGWLFVYLAKNCIMFAIRVYESWKEVGGCV